MATFIATVRTDNDLGFTASFPDFPGCAAGAPTLDLVLARAKEALIKHLEYLLTINQQICIPTPAGTIERGDALLLAAIEVPDDFRVLDVELAIPALSLAQIDSFARRQGLTRGALFVQAVGRWAGQEVLSRERRSGVPEGLTLFDFGSPPEVKLEAAAVESVSPEPEEGGDRKQEAGDRGNTDDITAELERLLEEKPKP